MFTGYFVSKLTAFPRQGNSILVLFKLPKSIRPTGEVVMLTPEMLEVILPTLGFSIVLNILLATMLIFRPVARRFKRVLSTYWLGVLLLIRN